jgi:hypothetical protein
MPDIFSCHTELVLRVQYSAGHNGCVRLMDYFNLVGSVYSKQTVGAIPVPHCGLTVDSSATNDVKNGPVLNKRLQPGPTIERSGPNHTNK